MPDFWIGHSALVVCDRIALCGKPVPTFPRDALAAAPQNVPLIVSVKIGPTR
jgi:hypothetical protein